MAKQSKYNKEETTNFIKLTKEALKNEEKKAEWNGIRAMYGIYPERDKGTYMLRPRFPGGKITLDNFKFFSELGENYGDKRIHITTRQDIQLHGLKFEDLPKVLEELLEKGYSSRATGGNSARAVIAPPMSGFEEEVFDVTNYAEAVTEYILNSDNYMGLPRKYKIAFSNNEKNSLYVKISDLGFLATEKDGVKGFKIYGAGGLGAVSKEAIVLADFIKKEDFLYHVVAMRNLFAEHGDRNNKARARIRYIAIKLGKEEFIKLYNSYLEEAYKEKLSKIVKETKVELSEEAEIKISGNILKSNIKGRYGYYFHPINGDIYTDEADKMVEVLKNIPYELDLRLTSSQGLVIRNLMGKDVQEIKNLDKFGEKNLYKSVVCVGKTICNLGILDTPSLLRDIFKYFKTKQRLAKLLPVLRISGCPNSCGAHHIGELGFWGKKKAGEPYFSVVARGNFENETITLNKNIADIKGTEVPKFLEELAIILRDKKITFKKFLEIDDDFEKLVEKFKE